MKAIVVFLFTVFFSGCVSPVRHDIFISGGPLPAAAQAEEKGVLKPAETERFKDTVIMNTGDADAGLVAQAAQADELFKNRNIRQACEIYEQLAQTVAGGDSLEFEVRFMLSECSSENQDFEQSLEILKSLSESDGIPDAVLEKTLVRLGQVHCILENKSEANAAFTLLKRMFPKSVYLPVATCSAVK